MQLSEIYNKKWQISKNLKINKIRISGLEGVEQEFHINIVAVGFENPKEEEALLCCSIQKYITKLSKNFNFKLEEVIITSGLQEGNDRILQIMGKMYDTKLILIKFPRKKYQVNPEETKKRIERMNIARAVKNKNSK